MIQEASSHGPWGPALVCLNLAALSHLKMQRTPSRHNACLVLIVSVAPEVTCGQDLPLESSKPASFGGANQVGLLW
jgi:hypothetical protein